MIPPTNLWTDEGQSRLPMSIRSLDIGDLPALHELAALADAEGFRFVRRFLDDVALERVALDAPCEFFPALVEGEQLLAIGGVTPDPYIDDASIGRLRHVYVRPDVRGKRIGRALVRHLEVRAARCYASVRLRTDTPAAARFYERLGYDPVDSKSATHQRSIRTTSAEQRPDER